MKVIDVRNVEQALVEGCYQIKRNGVERHSRNGKVLVYPETMATVYRQPTERVLLDPDRDANPFFHLMEALWMLAGRNDVEFPRLFNSKFGQYSDDGLVFNGAYGYRWRRYFGGDQIKSIIAALQANPDCRRQVLAMWDGSRDLGAQSKDIPCNLNVTVQVSPFRALDIMVSNRSNDLIWGAYGANAVHFSILQEYLASALRMAPGIYTQVSANTHVYEPHWDLMNRLAAKAPMPPSQHTDQYSRGRIPYPLVNLPLGRWDRELHTFLAHGASSSYDDAFFEGTAKPMYSAWMAFREREDPGRFTKARTLCYQIAAKDWQQACVEWLDRRELAAAQRVP